MDLISAAQGFVLEKFVPFVVLLGLLIFVHELGHFLVAKYFKVRVEVFSLGFGKKIFQFVRGHTTYCISLIPLGGYVKMFGDDPSAEIPPEEEKEAFTRKPVGARIAIILAGPLMNFFFAILLFAVVALVGEKAIGPSVGDVKTSSHAAQVGFLPGDQILSINGKEVKTWDHVSEVIENNINTSLTFDVLRGKEKLSLSASPKETENKDPMKWADVVGEIDGLSPSAAASVIGVDSSFKNVAWSAGLRPLDHVTSVNGQSVRLWRDFSRLIIDNFGNNDVLLEIERLDLSEKKENKKVSINLNLASFRAKETSAASLYQLGIEPPDIYLAHISEGMPAEVSGLQPKDKILSIQGKKITQWDEVIKTVNAYKVDTKPFNFEVLRDGEIKEFSISPRINSFLNQHGQEEHRYQVGIGPGIFRTADRFILNKADGLFAATVKGWDQTIDWTATMCTSFVRLLQNQVSPKNIGSVFSIGQAASETFKAGLSPYLKIMAIISINLFIFNLFPIPLLDGGHLLFYTIEALRGAPVSMKKLEVAQQIGFLLLISLMAFAIFNDISRIW